MGISKRQLLEDFYFDEFIVFSEEYGKANAVSGSAQKDEEVFIDQIRF